MSNRVVRRRSFAMSATMALALGLVVGAGAIPAQAGPDPLQLLVTHDLYGYELQANLPFFGQNGFIVDRATQIAESLAYCPACTPAPTTPMPAGYTNLRMDVSYADGTTNLDQALADALYENSPAVVDSTNGTTFGGVGTWTNGNRTYAVLLLADYTPAPLDEIPIKSFTIVGVPRVGAVLTAVVDPSDPTSIGYTYQWNSNGIPFGTPSANPSIQLTAAQLGKRVAVTLTATEVGSVTRTVSTRPFGPILPAYLAFPHVVTLQGQLYIGQRVGLSQDTIEQFRAPGSELHLRYVWTRNGRPIHRAPSEPTYTLTPHDLGTFINVIVIATAPGYYPALVKTHTTQRATEVPPNG